MLDRSDLRNYQNAIIDKIHQCVDPDPKTRLPGLVIALEPGAGKTGAVLTALKDQLEAGDIRKVLIVSTVLVAQTTWPDEFDEWSHLTGTPFTLIRVEDDNQELVAATKAAYARAKRVLQRRFDQQVERLGGGRAAKARVKAQWDARQYATFTLVEKSRNRKPNATPATMAKVFSNRVRERTKERMLQRLALTDTPFHIINKEALRWLWKGFRGKERWPYDVLVADDLRESRTGKRRTKTADENNEVKLSRWGVLAKSRSAMKYTLQLTGTPTPKGLENMWGLLYPIDLGRRLGPNKTQFIRRWFNDDWENHKTEPRTYAHREIMDRVKDVMFALSEKDAPDLPPYVLDPIKVQLPDETLREYRRFERTLMSEEFDVRAVNNGVLHGKLLQFANGSMYREDGEDVPIHDLKIEALKDLADRLDGEPLLVAYTYEFDKARICKALPQTVVLRPENAVETKRRWNAGEIQILLAHRASAGHGLNLQKGGHHMCEYGLTSDAELYYQFLKRLHRKGQKHTVFNHVIIAKGTIDEDIYPDYLDPKMATQKAILDEVRLEAPQPETFNLMSLVALYD